MEKEKLLTYLLGTSDYTIVVAGFILSFMVALYPILKERKFSIRDILLNLLSIFIFMRFYSFIIDFSGFQIDLENSLTAALLAGLISRKLVDKFHKEVNDKIDEL